MWALLISSLPFLIDPSNVPVPAWERQVQSSCAYDSINGIWLVVWTDLRYGYGWEIVGTRVDTTGRILDTLGIWVGPREHWTQDWPRVIYVNGNFLITWRDVGQESQTEKIEGVWISPQGEIISPYFDIVPEGYKPSYYSLSADPNGNILLVFQSSNWNDWDLYGVWVQGTTVSAPFPIMNRDDWRERFPYFTHCVTYDGSEFVISYQYWGWWDGIGYSFISPLSTVPSDTQNWNYAGYQKAPVVAYGNNIILTAWSDTRNTSGTGGEIFVQRIRASDNALLDTNGILISPSGWNEVDYVNIAFDGTYFIIIAYLKINGKWNIGYLVVSASDLSLPSVVSSGLISLPSQGEEIYAISGAKGHVLFCWRDYRVNSMYDIYGARLKNGILLDTSGFRITHDYQTQRTPSAVFDGKRYFVVWCDNRNSGDLNFSYTSLLWSDWDIYGIRVDTLGNPIDAKPIEIAVADGPQFSPSVTYNDVSGEYFVTWMDRRNGVDFDIYGVRIDTNGIVKDTAPILISSASYDQRFPDVIFDPVFNYYFVAWEDFRAGELQKTQIYGARVAGTGVVLDPNGIPISDLHTLYDATPNKLTLHYTPDGNYLSIWWKGDSSNPNYGAFAHLYGARVNPQGIVLDPGGKRLTGDSLSWEGGAWSVTFEDTTILLVYEDASSFANIELKLLPLSLNLTPVDTVINITRSYEISEMGPTGARISQYHFILYTLDWHDLEGYFIHYPTRTILGPYPVAVYPRSDEWVDRPVLCGGNKGFMAYISQKGFLVPPSPGYIRSFWRVFGKFIEIPTVNLALTEIFMQGQPTPGDSQVFQISGANLGNITSPTPLHFEIVDTFTNNILFTTEKEGERVIPGDNFVVNIKALIPSQSGEYIVKVWHKLPFDTEPVNDTLILSLTEIKEGFSFSDKKGIQMELRDRRISLLVLSSDSRRIKIELFDPVGRKRWSVSDMLVPGTLHTFTSPELLRGVYFLKVSEGGKMRLKSKVLVIK